jgi:proteasome lid subunit RPN8/RPN11
MNSAKLAPKPKTTLNRASPTIRLTPYAWAKLLYLRDLGPTEIGGFGISRTEDLLLIEDLCLVRQRCDYASVELEDAAVADFFDELVDVGRRPEEFGRIWVHTHPGKSARPSLTDEATFTRVFGACQWSVMLIVARGGETYARLKFGVGPGGSFEAPVEVDYDAPFQASDAQAWRAEYDACVDALEPVNLEAGQGAGELARLDENDWFGAYDKLDLAYLREEALGD